MARKEYRGAAGQLTLAAGIDTDDTSFSADGLTAGWPTGTDYPFVVVLDAGNAAEEKILCTNLSGATFNVSQRGFDGTTAANHSIGATIQHRIDADTLTDTAAHIYDTGRDDHEQYALVDGSRPFTNIDDLADTVVAVGTANAEGVSQKVARADHVHDIADDAVGAAQIAAGAVGSSELADDAVDSGALQDDSVLAAHLATDSVTSDAILADAVGNAELHADAATLAKLHKAIHVGFVSGTTDGSGNFTVAHGADFTPSAIFIQMLTPAGGANAGHPVVTSIGAANFSGRMIGTSGSMAGLSISLYWLAVA